MTDDYDPLAETDRAPAISWADLPDGTVQTLDVSTPCSTIHKKDYDSGEYLYWQPKGRPTANVTDKPVQQMIFNGLDKNGEAAALFVTIKGEQLFFKLAEAQKAYGKRIGAGDTVDRISIKLTGRTNAEGKKQNQFVVKVSEAGKKQKPVEADPFDSDPWGDTQTPAAPAGDEPPF
jgi:hypothetical protein